MADVFGPLIESWTIERAVLALLQSPPAGGDAALVIYYLAEKERQLGLTPRTLKTPPGPSSYQGGVDPDTLMAEWFPMLHVIVTPNDLPVPLDVYTYGQEFRLQIVATAGDDDENFARRNASCLAIAAAKAILDFGSLKIGAINTRLASSPTTALLAPNKRQVIRATVELITLVEPILTIGAPLSFAADPYDDPAPLPEVTSVNVTLHVNPDSQK